MWHAGFHSIPVYRTTGILMGLHDSKEYFGVAFICMFLFTMLVPFKCIFLWKCAQKLQGQPSRTCPNYIKSGPKILWPIGATLHTGSLYCSHLVAGIFCQDAELIDLKILLSLLLLIFSIVKEIFKVYSAILDFIYLLIRSVSCFCECVCVCITVKLIWLSTAGCTTNCPLGIIKLIQFK